MSVSAIFGTRMVALPTQLVTFRESSKIKMAPKFVGIGNGGLLIECSSRPQKKATAHHKKTRPRKTQAWDIRRGPTVYPPLPKLPPEWTLVTEDSGDANAQSEGSLSQPLES